MHGGNHDGGDHDGCDRGCRCGAGRGRVAEVPARAGHGAVLQGVEHVPPSERDAHRRPGDDRVDRPPQRRRQRPRRAAPGKSVHGDFGPLDTLKSLFKKQAKPPMDYNFGVLRPVPRRPPGAGCRAGLPHHPGQLVPPPARRRGEGEGRVGPARRADGPGVPLLVAAGRARRLVLPRRADRAREQSLRHDDGFDDSPRHQARRDPADRGGVHAGLRLQGQGKRLDGIDRGGDPRRRLARVVRPGRRPLFRREQGL